MRAIALLGAAAAFSASCALAEETTVTHRDPVPPASAPSSASRSAIRVARRSSTAAPVANRRRCTRRTRWARRRSTARIADVLWQQCQPRRVTGGAFYCASKLKPRNLRRNHPQVGADRRLRAFPVRTRRCDFVCRFVRLLGTEGLGKRLRRRNILGIQSRCDVLRFLPCVLVALFRREREPDVRLHQVLARHRARARKGSRG